MRLCDTLAVKFPGSGGGGDGGSLFTDVEVLESLTSVSISISLSLCLRFSSPCDAILPPPKLLRSVVRGCPIAPLRRKKTTSSKALIRARVRTSEERKDREGYQ